MDARGEEKQSTNAAGGMRGGVEVFTIRGGDRRLSNGVKHKEGAGKHRLWVNLDTQHILGIAGHEQGAALLTASNIDHDHAVRDPTHLERHSMTLSSLLYVLYVSYVL
jgi:hypothetical protein